jgi:hypothetical protein
MTGAFGDEDFGGSQSEKGLDRSPENERMGINVNGAGTRLDEIRLEQDSFVFDLFTPDSEFMESAHNHIGHLHLVPWRLSDKGFRL